MGVEEGGKEALTSFLPAPKKKGEESQNNTSLTAPQGGSLSKGQRKGIQAPRALGQAAQRELSEPPDLGKASVVGGQAQSHLISMERPPSPRGLRREGMVGKGLWRRTIGEECWDAE